MVIKLKGPKGGCSGAERGVKFRTLSCVTSGRNVDVGAKGRGTLVKANCVKKRGILLIGPRAFVGLDKRDLHPVVSFCGLRPRSFVVVRSSVSLSIKELHVQEGKDTKKRGKLGDVVDRLKDVSFPEIGVNIKRGPGKCSLTSCMLKRFAGRRRTVFTRHFSRICSTMRLVIVNSVARTVGHRGGGG